LAIAGGQIFIEQNFEAQIPFDGRRVYAQAPFVDVDRVLVGTRLLRHYRLLIEFLADTVFLERMTYSADGTQSP
jgi:hypothetical protein